jgi:hypothetical protein
MPTRSLRRTADSILASSLRRLFGAAGLDQELSERRVHMALANASAGGGESVERLKRSGQS